MGKMCIEVKKKSKQAQISEELCIGCGLRVKQCPYKAIIIINLSTSLEQETSHRYGKNGFKLHLLPIPRPGQVLGLVGTNGIGKSMALKILGLKLCPNLGQIDCIPDWNNIVTYYRGSELQNYFLKILESSQKVIIKPQYVDMIPKKFLGRVSDYLNSGENKEFIYKTLDIG